MPRRYIENRPRCCCYLHDSLLRHREGCARDKGRCYRFRVEALGQRQTALHTEIGDGASFLASRNYESEREGGGPRTIWKNEVRWEEVQCDDAELVITAYGTPARIALTAIDVLRAEGYKVGLFRPVTIWPFPEKALHDLAAKDHVKVFLDTEMSSVGQMIDDVRLAVEGQKPIYYTGRAGGVIPAVEEIVEAAKKALKEVQ